MEAGHFWTMKLVVLIFSHLFSRFFHARKEPQVNMDLPTEKQLPSLAAKPLEPKSEKLFRCFC